MPVDAYDKHTGRLNLLNNWFLSLLFNAAGNSSRYVYSARKFVNNLSCFPALNLLVTIFPLPPVFLSASSFIYHKTAKAKNSSHKLFCLLRGLGRLLLYSMQLSRATFLFVSPYWELHTYHNTPQNFPHRLARFILQPCTSLQKLRLAIPYSYFVVLGFRYGLV